LDEHEITCSQIQGYDGVKTGTTTAAGACLVATVIEATIGSSS